MEGPFASDTIPAQIKHHFFAGKKPPSLANYDVIGFDADHCIVKYNVRALMLHITQM